MTGGSRQQRDHIRFGIGWRLDAEAHSYGHIRLIRIREESANPLEQIGAWASRKLLNLMSQVLPAL
jgi:hypothetical protein